MEIISRTENDQVIVTRCLGTEQRVALPEQIDGLPVTALEDYAFSPAKPQADEETAICGEKLLEIRLPQEMRRIGGYAFYGCRRLERMTLYHRTEDIAGGAFTGCYRLRELYVYMQDAWGYCLKDIVSELRQELRVTLDYGNGKAAMLLFPEYYEEAVENTPARILETHFHGSGYHYRQCFRDGELNFQEYDRLFGEAAAWESVDFCIELCLLRLRYPYRLSEDAGGIYQAWLMEHRREAASWCLAFEQQEALEYLCTFIDWSAQELEELIREANEGNRMESQSFLMDYKYRSRKRSVQSFEL
ncbi:hypothetical protein BRYFOR_09221 [Marvinbryantia formatexigens DSM 14469]|uniref:Leucine-rich repeat domain-containing protein n=1 Tax=Marvinbryantia formatexigens DSM 14469 TaxID=478749 RepID=C6LKM5_9FIRM|nr:leucine-rich repeat protein [Marvinbryantia formatexigens]EET58762.1 hypothetical protein BRYFOR_09221 [Marvinbryantia formatexigens DSM 14469]UWO24110.1 leucine-rich repeat domain-containing protein [Marvinbryantia formatexigens DSM 14469]SDG68939.1 Leucine rich repeat-containing protein [Marvinbryantia formatexigens]